MTQPIATRNMAHIDGEMVISRCKRDNMGFVTEDDVAAIASDPRTRLTTVTRSLRWRPVSGACGSSKALHRHH